MPEAPRGILPDKSPDPDETDPATTIRPDPRQVRRLSRLSALAAALTMALGVVALADFWLGLSAWVRLLPGPAWMKANTALGLVLAGASLWLLIPERSPRRRRYSGWTLAALAALLGLLAMGQDVLDRDLGIDSLLVREFPELSRTQHPLHITPSLALNLLLAGGALLLLDVRHRSVRTLSQVLAVVVAASGLLTLIGTTYAVDTLEVEQASQSAVAIRLAMAMALLVLGLGILGARPECGLLASATDSGPGGLLLRRLLPAAVLVPFLLGWLRQIGRDLDYYDGDTGTALFAIAHMAIFAALIWWHAELIRIVEARSHRLNLELEQRVVERTAQLEEALLQKDAEVQERRRAEQKVQEALEALRLKSHLMRGIIEGTSDLISALDMNYRFIAFNAAYEREFQEIFGRAITLGTNLIDALAHLPDDQRSAVEIWGWALAGKEFTVEHLFGDECRGQRIYEITFGPIRDEHGQLIGASSIVRDSTARKLAEKKAREETARADAEAERAQLHSLLMQAPASIALFEGPDLLYILANSEHERVSGGRPLIGRPLREAKPELVEQGLLKRYEQVYATGTPLIDRELRVLMPRAGDGALVPGYYDLTLLPLQGADGVVYGLLSFAVDVTEQVEGRLHLRESEARFRGTFENAAVGIAHVDFQGRWLRVNQRLCDIVGYTREELTSKTFQEITHPDDLKADLDQFHLLIHGEIPTYSMEKRYFYKNGQVIWIYLTVSAQRDGSGRTEYGIFVIQDISDRKRLEEELRQRVEALAELGRVRDEALALLDSLLENAPIGFAFFDREFRYARINAFLAEINGLPVEAHLGRPVREILPVNARVVEPVVARIFEDGQPVRDLEVEGETPKAPGVRRFWLTSFYPVRSAEGQVRLVGGVVTEITERKRAEVALRDSEERFRQLAETIREVFYITESNSVKYVSPAYETIWGRSREELYGHPGSFLEVLAPEDRPRVEAAMVRQGNGENSAEEYRIVREDGQSRWIWDRAYPAVGPDGRVTRIFGIAEDITDRKLAEASLKESDRRKGEFLAVLSHELRNPLAALSNARLVASRDGSAEALAFADEVIGRQLNQLTLLIDDLLDLSRIDRGKVQLRLEPLDLAMVLDRAVESVRPLIEENGHRLVTTVADASLIVQADATRMEQVVTNLLTNAVKYTPPGGLIRLTARREGAEQLVRVRDTGIGIPAEMLPRIFEMFAQVDTSLDRSKGGLGIGLTLVRRLVELHGGTVSARSGGTGKGSEFTVRLPSAEAIETHDDGPTGPTANASSSSLPVEGAVRPSGRVLIVDDNVDSALGLARLLRVVGYEVRVAHDGPSGLEMAQEDRPDIALLDIGLPGMDGYQLARSLNQQEPRPALLLAISGYGQDHDRQRSRKAGFDDHLTKPVDFDRLLGRLRQQARPG